MLKIDQAKVMGATILCVLFLLMSCGGSGGSGSISSSSSSENKESNPSSDQPDNETSETSPTLKPNGANKADVTILVGEECKTRCLEIKNGRDIIESGKLLAYSFLVLLDDRTPIINGESGTPLERNSALMASFGGKQLYVAGLYGIDSEEIDEQFVFYPSAYYGTADLTATMDEVGYSGVNYLPVDLGAEWSWTNVFAQVAVLDSNGEKNLIKDENGIINLNSDQTWNASFANGALTLDGRIDGSQVEGTAEFSYNGKNMVGGFVGSDGLLENGEFETSGAFAGSSQDEMNVFAGNWFENENSINSEAQD